MDSLLVPALIVLPFACAALSAVLPNARTVLRALALGTMCELVLAAWAAARVLRDRSALFAVQRWFMVDALSAYHLVVMALVFLLSALFALGYFAEEIANGKSSRATMRQFGALAFASLGAMALVLTSNHLAMMWIGIEATTLLTAFLICLHVTPTSLEAMWKYLLVCSVGVAFAFLGTLLVEVAARHTTTPGPLLWTRLRAEQSSLDPVALKAAFVFLLVGYGTKAGLAPMHSWLPDAHSQAPAPVSALFSGFMLNAALYSIMRYIPLVDGAPGASGFAGGLLTLFGLVSIVVAGAFILVQKDVKRLLAYSSVEHIGIMAVGLGLGGLGTFAALYHTLGHSLGKSLAFFSAGRLGQERGTHDIAALSGALRRMPLWGAAFVASLLALLGAAPFAIFMSELLIVRASLEKRAIVTMVIFLFGTAVVFVGALRHVLTLAWGATDTPRAPSRPTLTDRVVVATALGLLLVFGLVLPPPLRAALQMASDVVGGRP
jgi:hydrogenase-4 component F